MILRLRVRGSRKQKHCCEIPCYNTYADALGIAARARGMSGSPSNPALYKALRSDAHPRFETISRVCAALGVKLVAQPVH